MIRENEEVERPPKNLWRPDEEEEDPLVALGQMVKLASIGIWRRVSSGGKKLRPGMQERSNSDSVLEIGRPVTFSDAGDQVLVELVDEGKAKTSVLQAETTAIKTTEGVEEVVVQTEAEVAPTTSVATEEL